MGGGTPFTKVEVAKSGRSFIVLTDYATETGVVGAVPCLENRYSFASFGIFIYNLFIYFFYKSHKKSIHHANSLCVCESL